MGSQLLAGTHFDFGLWSFEHRAVVPGSECAGFESSSRGISVYNIESVYVLASLQASYKKLMHFQHSWAGVC